MKLTPRKKKLFCEHPSTFDPGPFQLVHYEYVEEEDLPDDGGQWPFTVVARGKDLRGLWGSWARQLAKNFDVDVKTASRQILSGEDTGDWFTCGEESYLKFYREIETPSLVVAAFEATNYCDVRFGRAAKTITSKQPGWDYLVELSAIQEDDIFWVRRKKRA